MSDKLTDTLMAYLDAEFGKRAGRAHPKVVFRGKDVIAGGTAALFGTKFASCSSHRARVAMGLTLNTIVTGTDGVIGEYRIVPLTGSRALGTQYMATRIKDDPHDNNRPD